MSSDHKMSLNPVYMEREQKQKRHKGQGGLVQQGIPQKHPANVRRASI